MGFGHRVYRAEDPRARVLRRTARGDRLAALRGRRGARAGRAGRAEGAQARPRAGHQRRVLVGRRARHRRGPRRPVHADVHLRARRPAGRRTSSSRSARRRLIRPTAKYVGAGPRPLPRSAVRATRGCSAVERRAGGRAAAPRRPASSRRSARRRRASAPPSRVARSPRRAAVRTRCLTRRSCAAGAALDEAAVLEPVDDPGDVGVVAVQRGRPARSSAAARPGSSVHAARSTCGGERSNSADDRDAAAACRR